MASRISPVALALALCAFAAATEVDQCPGDSSDLSNRVHLIPCKRLPCLLKKGKDQHITIEFIPERDIKDLKNSVSAEVFRVPLPFVGVDGNSICDKVFLESGEAASCPLKAGTKYTYKDSFPVLSIYPSINVKVKWALRDGGNDKEIVCFTVPARIA